MASESTLNDITAKLEEQNKTEEDQTTILREIAASLAGPSASQLAEQEQQFDLRIADMMGQYQKRSVEREGRENMTAYVAMGVGVLVIGGVFLLALRK